MGEAQIQIYVLQSLEEGLGHGQHAKRHLWIVGPLLDRNLWNTSFQHELAEGVAISSVAEPLHTLG